MHRIGRLKKKQAKSKPRRESAGKAEKPVSESVDALQTGKIEEAGWKGFCTAFANILGRELESSSPVLAETEIEKKLKASKEESKAKRLQSAENRTHRRTSKRSFVSLPLKVLSACSMLCGTTKHMQLMTKPRNTR